MKCTVLCLLGLLASNGRAVADELMVAVATNFLGTAQALQQAFEAQSDHRLVFTSGSTGQLYAQIVNGAPYDILLAADQERPRLLVEAGQADGASVFTYAEGRLVLWSRKSGLLAEVEPLALADASFRSFAIANPDVAPYGLAARQFLERAGSWDAITARIVIGQNIAQTFAMIETGNADLGLVALSQVLAYDNAGVWIEVDRTLHAPIRQDAVVLRRARGSAAAADFMRFLASETARALIAESGYVAG